MNPSERNGLIRKLVQAGMVAVDAGLLLERSFNSSSDITLHTANSKLVVVAAGKSAWPMFAAFARAQHRPITGGVIAAPPPPEPHPAAVELFVAGHPMPTAASVEAGRAVHQLARRLSGDDQLVVLLSGGASALLASPAPPVTLADKIAVTDWLLRGGASIDALNTVRKHLSLIKGGQLAAATNAAVLTLALSDVSQPFDDDPATIGSGPTVGDPTSFDDAWAILDCLDTRWKTLFPNVCARLADGRKGRVPETPKPGDPRLARADLRVIGNRHTAGQAAADEARRSGVTALYRQPAVTGEARDAAVAFVRESLAAADGVRPFCYVASGEPTVTVRGSGVGGRNQEFALAAAIELHRLGAVATVASIGTDGIDGPTAAAGAIVDETTCSRARQHELNPQQRLSENDSYTFFASLGDAIVTGPTGTNVGDLMIAVVG